LFWTKIKVLDLTFAFPKPLDSRQQGKMQAPMPKFYLEA
jgi:hypothetical protein